MLLNIYILNALIYSNSKVISERAFTIMKHKTYVTDYWDIISCYLHFLLTHSNASSFTHALNTCIGYSPFALICTFCSLDTKMKCYAGCCKFAIQFKTVSLFSLCSQRCDIRGRG